jgi:hypothetical protein
MVYTLFPRFGFVPTYVYCSCVVLVLLVVRLSRSNHWWVQRRWLFIYLFCLSSLLAREPETAVQWMGLSDGDRLQGWLHASNDRLRTLVGPVSVDAAPSAAAHMRDHWVAATMRTRCGTAAPWLDDDVGQSSPWRHGCTTAAARARHDAMDARRRAPPSDCTPRCTRMLLGSGDNGARLAAALATSGGPSKPTPNQP